MSADQAHVQITGLTKRFGAEVVAVDDLSLEVGEGEFLTLLGPSGCGKTTTLRCVGGLEAPDTGTITVGGQTVLDTTTGKWVPPEKRGAGMVFQSYAVWPHMTVFANVAYPLRMRRVPGEQRQRRVMEILEALGLGAYASRLATELSGGQQQRVALARAMVARPSLLLFDEPLSNLDAKLRAEMRVELRHLHEKTGTTSIYVTHDQIEAVVLSDRVAVMRAGRLRQLDVPETVYTRPSDTFVAGFVGFNNFVPARVMERQADEVTAQLKGGRLLRAVVGAHDLVPGDDIVLVARSGSVDVSVTTPPQEGNVLEAKVLDTVYLGDAMQYRLGAQSIELVADVNLFTVSPDVHGRRRWDVSDSVFVRIDPRWLVALPAVDVEVDSSPEPSRAQGDTS